MWIQQPRKKEKITAVNNLTFHERVTGWNAIEETQKKER